MRSHIFASQQQESIAEMLTDQRHELYGKPRSELDAKAMARIIKDPNEVSSGVTCVKNKTTNAKTNSQGTPYASRETESYLLMDLAKQLYNSATTQDFKFGRGRGVNGDPSDKLPISIVDFQPHTGYIIIKMKRKSYSSFQYDACMQTCSNLVSNTYNQKSSIL